MGGLVVELVTTTSPQQAHNKLHNKHRRRRPDARATRGARTRGRRPHVWPARARYTARRRAPQRQRRCSDQASVCLVQVERGEHAESKGPRRRRVELSAAFGAAEIGRLEGVRPIRDPSATCAQGGGKGRCVACGSWCGGQGGARPGSQLFHASQSLGSPMPVPQPADALLC